MSHIRDPAFWKRFSMAVHQDEEQAQSHEKGLSHSDSWLARQNAKKSRRTWICWIFWLSFLGLIAGVVAVVIWLLSSDVLEQSTTGAVSGNHDGGGS